MSVFCLVCCIVSMKWPSSGSGHLFHRAQLFSRLTRIMLPLPPPRPPAQQALNRSSLTQRNAPCHVSPSGTLCCTPPQAHLCRARVGEDLPRGGAHGRVQRDAHAPAAAVRLQRCHVGARGLAAPLALAAEPLQGPVAVAFQEAGVAVHEAAHAAGVVPLSALQPAREVGKQVRQREAGGGGGGGGGGGARARSRRGCKRSTGGCKSLARGCKSLAGGCGSSAGGCGSLAGGCGSSTGAPTPLAHAHMRCHRQSVRNPKAPSLSPAAPLAACSTQHKGPPQAPLPRRSSAGRPPRRRQASQSRAGHVVRRSQRRDRRPQRGSR